MLKNRKIIKKIVPWLGRDEIILIYGPRRVGKTTVLQLLKRELQSIGVEPANIFMMNLEDFDVLRELSQSPKALLKFIRNSEKKNYFLIDEIQYLEDPTHFLKYLYDFYRDKVKLVVTSSFLFEVKNKFRDSLVGRKISFNLTPLIFEEFIDFNDDSLSPYFRKGEIPGAIHNRFLELLEEYLIYGGLPEVVLTKDIEMKQMLMRDYVNTYLNKDIRYISGSNDILRYNDLLAVLASQISGLLNVEEICNTLGMKRLKVDKYLENLILSTLIHFIPPFYTNVRTQITKMKKIYLFDVGIRNQILHNFNSLNVRNDAGALFENFILNELINTYGRENIFFYRSKSGGEIDFIIKKEKVTPIEVKFKKLTRPVGLHTLSSFVERNDLKQGYLVNLTLNQKLIEKRIHVIDFLKFLNEQKSSF